jgi:hypothetical protein
MVSIANNLRSRGSLVMGLPIIATALFYPSHGYGYVPDDRWTSTASGSAGDEGDPITLTWGFARDGISIPNEGSSRLISYLDGIFDVSTTAGDLSQRPWFHLFSESFARWQGLSGITFQYEPNDDNRQLESAGGVRGVRADIRIGGANIDGSSGTLAYTLLPNNGDIVFDTGETSFFSNSANNYRPLRNTLMHELGHALGLEHVESSSSALLMEPFINTAFDGPQLDDIRGIQAFYGDRLETANSGQGNQTAALATSLGSLSLGGELGIGTAALGSGQAVAAGETDFVSIANQSDIDFFSFTLPAPATLDISLTPLGGTFTQGSQNGQQSSFNASARSDLSLALFDRNGTTLLATVNNGDAGQVESLDDFALSAAGEYFVRVMGLSDSVQLYQLELLAIATTIVSLEGDYNQNGVVDAADYILWRNSKGQSGASLAADGNGDGIVDDADYGRWRAHFGETRSGAGSALVSLVNVPQPSSAMLLLTTLFLVPICPRTRWVRRGTRVRCGLPPLCLSARFGCLRLGRSAAME